MAEKKSFVDDFEEYEVSEEHHPSKFGYVVKWIFFLLILFANGALIFRVCMAEDPRAVKSLAVNDALRAAYREYGDEFEIKTQHVYDMYTSDGIYYSTGLFYIPKARQIQVAVRYNIRTADGVVAGTPNNDMLVDVLESIRFFPPSPIANGVFVHHARSHVDISASDMRSGDFFAFRLVDDSSNYYTPTSSVKTTRMLYVYHKLTFDGVPEDGTNLYIEIYPLYGGLPDYTTVLGRMRVYSIERSADDYAISSSLKKELSRE